MPSHKQITRQQQAIIGQKTRKAAVPRNGKYGDTVRYGPKIVIIENSMIEGIQINEFNVCLKNGYAKLELP